MHPALPAISEAEFQKLVLEAARLSRWRRAHFRKVRVQRKGGAVYWETPVAADGKGFLDLVLVRSPRVIFAECKRDGERMTPEQELWYAALKACPGVEVYLWKPSDWATIERLLA